MKRFLAALAVMFALPVSAGTINPYSDVLYFGDSLTDSGNAAALAGQFNTGFDYQSYPLGQFTNGNTWATQLGATPSLLGGNNYAYGGARAIDNGDVIPDLAAQVDQFLQSGTTLGANPLASIWIGGNDFRDFAATGNSDPTAAANFVGGLLNEISATVTTLANAGVKEIIIFNLPDIGKAPNLVGTQLGAVVTNVINSYNSALASSALALNAWFAGTKITTYDLNSLFLSALGPNNPYGFTNWTQACLSNRAACQGNEDTWVFWDDIHPTDAVHSLIAADFSSQLAPVPLPAGFPLLLVGLGAFAVAAKRRKSLV